VTTGEVRVLDGGLLTTIQGALGRPGLGRFGVPPGGALDAEAALLANRLVGNHPDDPVLEITIQGPRLHWSTAAHVGLAGADLGAASEHLRLAPGFSYRLAAEAILGFDPSPGPARGARAYLAVEGGFLVERVLGSAATDRRSSIGGGEGRALRAGDVLRFRGEQSRPLAGLVRAHPGSIADAPSPVEIRVIPTGTDLAWSSPASIHALVDPTWTVSLESDRHGIRLTGGHIGPSSGRIPSLGVPVGAVQIPPSGEPLITMADGPVTGGYPIVGVVPRLDHGRLAQLAPGATLRFRRVTVEVARELEAAVAEAASRDRIEIDPGEVGAGWAG
jgi:antagonist of KipI